MIRFGSGRTACEMTVLDVEFNDDGFFAATGEGETDEGFIGEGGSVKGITEKGMGIEVSPAFEKEFMSALNGSYEKVGDGGEDFCSAFDFLSDNVIELVFDGVYLAFEKPIGKVIEGETKILGGNGIDDVPTQDDPDGLGFILRGGKDACNLTAQGCLSAVSFA